MVSEFGRCSENVQCAMDVGFFVDETEKNMVSWIYHAPKNDTLGLYLGDIPQYAKVHTLTRPYIRSAQGTILYWIRDGNAAKGIVLIDTSVGPTEVFMMMEGRGKHWYDAPRLRVKPANADDPIDPKAIITNSTQNIYHVNVTNPEFNGHKLMVLLSD